MVGHPLHENGKFVSTKTGDRVTGTDTSLQTTSHGYEQLIPDRVPEAVVDRFELVDVHKHHGDGTLAVACSTRGRLEPIHERRAVQRFRQAIMRGSEGQVFHHSFLCGD